MHAQPTGQKATCTLLWPVEASFPTKYVLFLALPPSHHLRPLFLMWISPLGLLFQCVSGGTLKLHLKTFPLPVSPPLCNGGPPYGRSFLRATPKEVAPPLRGVNRGPCPWEGLIGAGFRGPSQLLGTLTGLECLGWKPSGERCTISRVPQNGGWKVKSLCHW